MSGKREDYLSKEEYFMSLACLTSERSKDPKTRVGACIIDSNDKILSVGYNGAPKGMSDDDMPWDSVGEQTNKIMKIKNTFVIHAEANAIINYSGENKNLENSTLYVTLFPCNECAKLIAGVGIKKVIYLDMYKKTDLVEATKKIFECADIQYEELGQKAKVKIKSKY